MMKWGQLWRLQKVKRKVKKVRRALNQGQLLREKQNQKKQVVTREILRLSQAVLFLRLTSLLQTPHLHFHHPPLLPLLPHNHLLPSQHLLFLHLCQLPSLLAHQISMESFVILSKEDFPRVVGHLLVEWDIR